MRPWNSLMALGAAGLALVAASAACSSTSSPSSVSETFDGGRGRDAATAKDAARNLATDADVAACSLSASALCTIQASCNPTGQAADYGSRTTCEARAAIACEANLQAPHTAASVDHVRACATEEASEPCAVAENLETEPQCVQPNGTGGAGATCSHAAQCASAYCAIEPYDNCGKCAAAPKAGDSCLNLTTCGQGLTCTKAGTCAAFVLAVGGKCSVAEPCGTGLSCVAADGVKGICETEGFMVGSACDPATTTGAGCYDEQGYYCVSDPKSGNFRTCQSAKTATAGGACGTIVGERTDCVDSTCIKMADGSGSVCVAHAADGARCNTITGPDCQAPAKCVGSGLDGGMSGVCSLPGTFSCP